MSIALKLGRSEPFGYVSVAQLVSTNNLRIDAHRVTPNTIKKSLEHGIVLLEILLSFVLPLCEPNAETDELFRRTLHEYVDKPVGDVHHPRE
jgi:hypothetical protein